MERDRRTSLDEIKAIAAILVVFQHSSGTGVISGYLYMLARIAVPVFLLVSGYLYANSKSKEKRAKQISRYFVIAVQMEALYMAVNLFQAIVTKSAIPYLQTCFTSENILNFFVFNDPIFADHGWYMWAIIYVLIAVYVAPSFLEKKVLRYTCIIVTLLCGLIFGKYCILVLGKEVSFEYTRNALLVGVPYFFLGYSVGINSAWKKIGNVVYLGVLAVALALSIAERCLLIKFGVLSSVGFYFLTPVLSIAFFWYMSTKKRSNAFLATFGRKYSLSLYIVHPLFVRVEKKLFNMSNYQQYIGFAFVLVLSFLCVVVMNEVRKKWRKQYGQ